MAILIVLLIVAIAGCAALGVLLAQARSQVEATATKAGVAEVERTALVGRLDTARTEIDQLSGELAESRAGAEATTAMLDLVRAELASAQDERAETVGELSDVLEQLAASEAELLDAREKLAATEAELATATAAAADAITADAPTAGATAHGPGTDAGALWALELARSERRWRLSVAPGLDTPSPFVDAEDPLRLAVEIEAAALRDEVGTRTSVVWDLPAPLAPDEAVVVLRVCEELLATAAPTAETIDLRVGAEGNDIVVDLCALDDEGDELAFDTLPVPLGRVRLGNAGARR
ncbi:MAG TPA: hypothetical protein VGQ20_02640 [Acidimicrobiales bacterium]|jgi:hypothetical protein|nr:hypothetical protein [Acidimicrobiales bacterium]